MANLRVDKITSTETFERTGSVQFDGSGDYLTIPSNADLNPASGDFTLEMWVYPKSYNPSNVESGYNALYVNAATNGLWIGTYQGSFIVRKYGVANVLIYSSTPTVNEWTHVAITRKGSSLRLFYDGVLQKSATDSTAFVTAATYIGFDGSSVYWDGFISNLRFNKGQALYTKNFKVPMKELEVTPETKLLCCQSKTSAAAAKVSPNISGVNDGTIWSDALDVTNGGRLRHQDFGDASTLSPSLIFDGDTSTDAEGPNGTNNNIIYDFETLLGKSIPVSSSIKIVVGGNDGRTLKVNGTTIATNVGSAVQTITNQSTLNKIEVVAESSARSGRLADIKVDDVSLLLPVLPFGRNINASELSPGLLTDKVIDGGSSAIKGSVEFDGSGPTAGGYLEVTPDDDLQFLHKCTDSYTVEAWVHKQASTQGTIFDSGGSSSTTIGIILFGDSGGVLKFRARQALSGGGFHSIATGNVMANDMWHHVALTYDKSTVRLFVNGILAGSTSYSTESSVDSTQSFKIGAYEYSGTTKDGHFNGHISNLRVVKGTALYTHDFIPPTRELKKVPGTVLLCCQDPDNPLTEATGKTITPYGNLGDGSLGPELVTNNSVWTLTKSGSGATDWTVSNNGRSLAGTTVTSGYIRATYTVPKGDYLVSLRWTGGAFAVQDSTGYIVATDGTDTEFGASEDGAYSFYMSDTTSVVITGTTWNQAYTVDDISIKRIYKNNGASNFTPQVGNNRKVTFEGVTKINSDAYFYLPTGDTVTRDSRSGRGLFGGGFDPSALTNTIDFIQIHSSGNGQDFGDLTQAKQSFSGTANSTRGIFASGYNAPVFTSGHNTDRIEYISIASQGNAVTFGTIDSAIRYASCAASSTRALIAGGYYPSYIDRIEYITIASLGNAQTFGTLTAGGTATDKAGLSSPTRALFAGGEGPSHVSQIDYVTIATLGDAQDFGDLTAARRRSASASSGTRGLVAGGSDPSSRLNTIDYVTIASTGNAQDFGDLTTIRDAPKGQVCSLIRGVFGGGFSSPNRSNTIDYVTIASTGNAQDFGDMTRNAHEAAGCSDSHGGLG